MSLTCGFVVTEPDTTCDAPATHHFLITPLVHGYWAAYLTCPAHEDGARAKAVDEHPAVHPCEDDRSRWMAREAPGVSFCAHPDETAELHEQLHRPVLEGAPA